MLFYLFVAFTTYALFNQNTHIAELWKINPKLVSSMVKPGLVQNPVC